jgi:hypothetical protein
MMPDAGLVVHDAHAQPYDPALPGSRVHIPLVGGDPALDVIG